MTNPTCALILIGDELLSGRTPDANMNHFARRMGDIGVRFKECRVVPDDEGEIIDAIHALRKKYSYVFTTGGIGPTHDDITVDSIAKAFQVPVVKNSKVEQAFRDYFGDALKESTLKMAHFPKGADLVPNSVSIAPGFRMENVFCMAGIPKIFQVMLEAIIPTIEHGSKVMSKSVDVFAGESVISDRFEQVQNLYPTVDLGSYPFRHEGQGCTSLVVRSDDKELLEKAYGSVISFLNDLDVEYR